MCLTSNEVRRKASPKKIEPARVRTGIEELGRVIRDIGRRIEGDPELEEIFA